MSIIALYVYSPTTFTTDTPIEPMIGAPISAGEVTLQPGVYRLAAGAKLDAQTQTRARGETYSVVPLTDDKGGLPDPPLLVSEQYTRDEIAAFLTGAGGANELA
jgi:hypothetical protein